MHGEMSRSVEKDCSVYQVGNNLIFCFKNVDQQQFCPGYQGNSVNTCHHAFSFLLDEIPNLRYKSNKMLEKVNLVKFLLYKYMAHDPFSRISRNFSLKLNGSDRSKLKSFKETGPSTL